MSKNNKMQEAQSTAVLERVVETVTGCISPKHTIDITTIYVPAGQEYKHVCPACGHVTIIKGPNVFYKQQ